MKGVWEGFLHIPSENCCCSAGLRSGEGALATEGGGFLLHHSASFLPHFKVCFIEANSSSMTSLAVSQSLGLPQRNTQCFYLVTEGGALT